jgi:hypothetical protein
MSSHVNIVVVWDIAIVSDAGFPEVERHLTGNVSTVAGVEMTLNHFPLLSGFGKWGIRGFEFFGVAASWLKQVEAALRETINLKHYETIWIRWSWKRQCWFWRSERWWWRQHWWRVWNAR